MNMSLVLRLPRENASLQILFKCPTPANVFETAANTLTSCSLLTRCTIPCACHAKAHLNVQKCPVTHRFFAFLTSKCASCHNGVHFFNIATSKSGPKLVCFVHFDFEMCFAPQRRALFQHLNFQKVFRTWCVLYILTSKRASCHNGVHFFDIATSKSGPKLVCFVHFDFEMCFAPQRRALFQHLNFQKVFRTWCVLYILTSKCAPRHSGVQFFISHLARWLRARRFSEPTFRPSGATNHWKNTVLRDFATFSRACIFCLLLPLSLL